MFLIVFLFLTFNFSFTNRNCQQPIEGTNKIFRKPVCQCSIFKSKVCKILFQIKYDFPILFCFYTRLSTKQLPCIEDAWNFPISQEIASKNRNPSSSIDENQPNKKAKVDSLDSTGSPPALTVQQLQLMNYLQQNVNSLNPQQKNYLQQLQTQFTLHQQHQTATNDIQNGNLDAFSLAEQKVKSLLFPPPQSVASIAESLIAEFGLGLHKVDQLNGNDSLNCDQFRNEDQSVPKSKTSVAGTQCSIAYLDGNGDGEFNIQMSASDIVTHCQGKGVNGEININLLTEMEAQKQQRLFDEQHDCLPNELEKTVLPLPDESPYPPPPISRLQPPTPSVFLECKKDAHSQQLQQFCLAHPIAVIRGIANVLKMDLGLFSTKTLVESNPEHLIEVRTQMSQPSDENWHPQKKQMVWYCESHRSHSTIARYAHYQASTFQESLKEEQHDKNNGNASFCNGSSLSNSNGPDMNCTGKCSKSILSESIKLEKLRTPFPMNRERQQQWFWQRQQRFGLGFKLLECFSQKSSFQKASGQLISGTKLLE